MVTKLKVFLFSILFVRIKFKNDRSATQNQLLHVCHKRLAIVAKRRESSKMHRNDQKTQTLFMNVIHSLRCNLPLQKMHAW